MEGYKYSIDGISLLSYCSKNSIPYSSIIHIIKLYDIPVEQAVEKYLTPKKKNSRCFIYMNDGTLLKDYCDEHNICYSSCLRRMRKYGCSAEESINKRKSGQENYLLYKGKAIKDILNHTDYDRVNSRVRRGWHIWKAMQTEKQQRIYYKGKPLRQWCKDHRHYNRARKRISEGWDIYNAIFAPCLKCGKFGFGRGTYLERKKQNETRRNDSSNIDKLPRSLS